MSDVPIYDDMRKIFPNLFPPLSGPTGGTMPKKTKHEFPAYQRPTEPNEEMSEDRVEFLKQWPSSGTKDELRRFIAGWEDAKRLSEKRMKAFEEGRAKATVEQHDAVYDKAYELGKKHGRESAWEALGVDRPLQEGQSIYNLDDYSAQEGVNDEQEVEDASEVVEEVATEAVGAESAGIFVNQFVDEDEAVGRKVVLGGEEPTRLLLAQGFNPDWQIKERISTGELTMDHDAHHHQDVRQTEVVGDGKFVNPGAELARRAEEVDSESKESVKPKSHIVAFTKEHPYGTLIGEVERDVIRYVDTPSEGDPWGKVSIVDLDEPASSIALDTQPDPIDNGERSAHDMVIEDLIERKAHGLREYGVTLQASNGRDHLVDAYQEALDLVAYLRAAIAKRDGK